MPLFIQQRNDTCRVPMMEFVCLGITVLKSYYLVIDLVDKSVLQVKNDYGLLVRIGQFIWGKLRPLLFKTDQKSPSSIVCF